jgi:hypothetical protein
MGAGTEWFVDCANGDDANSGAQGSPKATIRAATANAVSGDVIRVAPGTYGAAEGVQTTTGKVASRVVIPAGVTLESTDGAEKTFIVGAEATGESIDNETYGTGANAVRCVYAQSGAILRGFTLTGGHTVGTGVDSGNGFGSAFFSAAERKAVIEDCVVSNNAAYRGTINQAVVRRCRIFENIGIVGTLSGAAGHMCNWYGCVIDRNWGNDTIGYVSDFVNCTIGTGNTSGAANHRTVYTTAGCTFVNSAVLGGGLYPSGGNANLYMTNCLVVSQWMWNGVAAERLCNTIYTNAAAAAVDAAYCPVFGSFVGIDAGDTLLAPASLGERDILATPRVLNGRIDIGAVEYDWRPTFSVEISRRLTVTYASPSVTMNATGGLLVPDGAVAGTLEPAGRYALLATVTGGSLTVYVCGEAVATSASLPGEQKILFSVDDAADEVRFVFTPDAGNPGAAVLRGVGLDNGTVIYLR